MFGLKRFGAAMAAAWAACRSFVAAHKLWVSAGAVVAAALVYVALVGQLSRMEAELLEVGLWGWAVKLVRFVTLLAILRGLLWWLDLSLCISFTDDVWPELKRGNLAVAVYFSSRLVAVAILGHGFL